MKKFFAAGILAALLFACNLDTHAAGDRKKNYSFRAAYSSKEGYWVVQKTQDNGKTVVILFYNNHHDLVGKETRVARNADISRKKVLRSLKRSLENALDWAEPI